MLDSGEHWHQLANARRNRNPLGYPRRHQLIIPLKDDTVAKN